MEGTLLSGVALVFVVNILTSIIKKWIFPRFGALGVQVLAFLLASVGAFYVLYGGDFPGLQAFLTAALAVFSTAVTFYEVVLKRIGPFQ